MEKYNNKLINAVNNIKDYCLHNTCYDCILNGVICMDGSMDIPCNWDIENELLKEEVK